ncbi:hypothetical protein DYI25_11585 [Mesobacillus boroniphilus]|uniref:Uncharacterized protein n=2 Tax=Mesobacillus boroniphilus TaxID=308892 RepID=A0A944CMD2_9BACI|nr:hypothetical protein [Mesobacillus boroniphilus]
MEGLLFLLISIVITFIVIFVVPLGLIKKEKMILAFSASVIGIMGLISVFIIELWQVMALMLLLAISTGYIFVNRFTSANELVPLAERVHSNRESEEYEESETKSLPKKEMENEFVLRPITVRPAKNITNIEEAQPLYEEDISFLEDRNRLHNDIPETNAGVYHIGTSESFEDDRWMVEEYEPKKIYAGTHS